MSITSEKSLNFNYSKSDSFDEILDSDCRRRDVMRIEVQLGRQAKNKKNKEDDRGDRERINGDFLDSRASSSGSIAVHY